MRPSLLRPRVAVVALSIALVVSVVAAVAIGPVTIPFGRVWRIVFDSVAPRSITPDWTPAEATIALDLRLPRVLLGAVVGAGLAVVGAALQALVRNPLADPYIIGVSSGASLGAVLVIVVGIVPFGVYSQSVGAFLGGLAAFGFVYLFAKRSGQVAPLRLILAGVAVGALASALTSFVVFSAQEEGELRSALFWLLGGLAGTRWFELTVPALAVLLSTVALLVQARALNALSVGEETAVTLGIDVHRLRGQLVALAALLVGVMVAVSGGIGFVALMTPHVVRLLAGPDHRWLLPLSALTGAIFLVWVDVGARMLAPPAELPIGVITAAVGAPFFLWLLRRQDRRAEVTG